VITQSDPAIDPVLFDLNTGTKFRTIHYASATAFSHAVFTPDSSQVVLCGEAGPARVWDVARGHERRPLNAALRDRMAISPDGKLLAGASGADVPLIDLGRGKFVRALGGPGGRLF